MKSKIVGILFAASALPLSAALSLDLGAGPLKNSSGAVVPDGTLWALVVDGGDNTFAGFGLGSGLATQPVGTADSFFTPNQSVSIGQVLGGGTVFALGVVNGGAQDLGGGVFNLVSGLSLGTNGLATGNNFAIYWFPGGTLTNATSGAISGQVGGIHGLADAGGGFTTAMVIPADGATVSVGVVGADFGGSVANETNFLAVNLIPEPSAALLGAFGVLGLLRRRRI